MVSTWRTRLFIVLAAAAVSAGLVAACGGASTPPPLTPDGPDMDLDAARYQDDAEP